MHIELVDNANKISYFDLYSEMMQNHGKLGKYYTLYQNIDVPQVQALAEQSADLPDKARDNTRFIMMVGGRAHEHYAGVLMNAYTATLLDVTSCQKDKKAKTVLQIFASEVGLMMNSSTSNAIVAPGMNIIDRLDKETLLDDYTLTLDAFKYAEAKRIRRIHDRNNITGYSAFMR